MTAAVSEVLLVEYSCGERNLAQRPEFHRHAHDLADDLRKKNDPFELCLKASLRIVNVNLKTTLMAVQ